MTVRIVGEYVGNKGVRLIHAPSGAVIQTAAPIDNQGDGSSFSPTDLVAAALPACMITVMAIVADRHQLDLSGTTCSVEKEMAASPRRIARLNVELHLPEALGDSDRQLLERAAHTCPVHATLSSETVTDLRFVYDVQRP